MEKKNKSIMTTIGVIVGGLAGYFLVQFLFFAPPSYSKILAHAADEINKVCPIQVDQETILNNAVALPDNIVQYNYTLINYERAAIDTALLKQNMAPGIINNIKTSPQMKLFRDNKTTLAYHYVDKNGVFVVRLVFTPERYN